MLLYRHRWNKVLRLPEPNIFDLRCGRSCESENNVFKKLSYDCTCLIDLRTVPPRNLHLRQGSFYTKNASRANSERIFGIKHIQNPQKFSACGSCKFKPRIFKTQCFWKNMSEMHFMSEISDLGQTGGGITQIQGVQCARPKTCYQFPITMCGTQNVGFWIMKSISS